MNRKVPGGRGKSGPSHRTGKRIGGKVGFRPARPRAAAAKGGYTVVDREEPIQLEQATPRPFRIVIAVHRPRYRGRAERAAALEGWEVISLLNKQDAVGQVSKGAHPPDIFVISGDFGRQRDYAIFRAVQEWRAKGMKIIAMVEDCETPPADFPESAPNKLSDICLTPPYTTAELRNLFARLYEEIRGEPAPAPRGTPSMELEGDMLEGETEDEVSS